MPKLPSQSTAPRSVKVVGSNGQISLGKQFAGRQVLVEEHEPGVWLIRTATIVPDNELWLQHPKAASDLKTALSWAQSNAPADRNAGTLLARLNGEV